jgi:hypothetical protein
MEAQNPSFSFELEYAGKNVNCNVVMEPQSYNMFFDSRFMATIVHTDDWTWIQESGVILPDAIIEEIGCRVESEYR